MGSRVFAKNATIFIDGKHVSGVVSASLDAKFFDTLSRSIKEQEIAVSLMAESAWRLERAMCGDPALNG